MYLNRIWFSGHQSTYCKIRLDTYGSFKSVLLSYFNVCDLWNECCPHHNCRNNRILGGQRSKCFRYINVFSIFIGFYHSNFAYQLETLRFDQILIKKSKLQSKRYTTMVYELFEGSVFQILENRKSLKKIKVNLQYYFFGFRRLKMLICNWNSHDCMIIIFTPGFVWYFTCLLVW